MRGNKGWLMIVMLGVSLLPWPASAAMARQEAVRFLAEYQTALETRSHDALKALFADDVRIRIDLEEAGGPSQRFTLTRARFLQQIFALWRFASEQTYTFSRPQYADSEGGTLTITVTQTEQRQLFGVEGGQRDVMTIVLDHRNGVLQIVDLHSSSLLW